jgi:hypothetical protein
MPGDERTGDRPPGGLIMQRMAVERGRAEAIISMVYGGILLAMGLTRGAPEDALDWGLIVGASVLGVVGFIRGIYLLRARARRIAEFDAQHGPDAGKQRPVG